jgi:multiple sugar transport system permease protein
MRGSLSFSSQRNVAATLLLLPALALLIGLLLYPLVLGIRSAFEMRDADGATKFVGGKLFSVLAHEPRFLADVLRSVVYVVGNVGISFVLGYGAALVITRPVRAAGIVRATIIIPWITPPVVSAVLFRSLVDPSKGPASHVVQYFLGSGFMILGNAQSAMATVIVHSVWRSFPFIMLMVAAGIAAIPSELYESAAVEGCGAFRRFRYITLPLTKLHCAIVLLIVTMWTIQDAEGVYALTSGGPGYSTEVVALRLFRESFLNFDLNIAAAVGVVLLLISAVFAALYLSLVGGKRVEL